MRQSLYLDVHSIERARSLYRASIDYHQLRTFLLDEEYERISAYAYLPIHPKTPFGQDALQKRLWEAGFIVKTPIARIVNGQVYSNIPLEIGLHILKSVYERSIKRFILITNNPDFTSLILQLRELGVTVILVTFSEALPNSFIEKANRVINLTQYLVEDEQEELNPLAVDEDILTAIQEPSFQPQGVEYEQVSN